MTTPENSDLARSTIISAVRICTSHWRKLLALYLLLRIPVDIVEFITDGLVASSDSSLWPLQFSGRVFLGQIFAVALMSVVQQRYDNQPVTLSVCLKTARKYWFISAMAGLALITLVFIGAMVLVVPGVIFLIRYLLVDCLVVYEDLTLLEAFKVSQKYCLGYWKPFAKIVVLVMSVSVFPWFFFRYIMMIDISLQMDRYFNLLSDFVFAPLYIYASTLVYTLYWERRALDEVNALATI